MKPEVTGMAKSGMLTQDDEQVWLVTVAMPRHQAEQLHINQRVTLVPTSWPQQPQVVKISTTPRSTWRSRFRRDRKP